MTISVNAKKAFDKNPTPFDGQHLLNIAIGNYLFKVIRSVNSKNKELISTNWKNKVTSHKNRIKTRELLFLCKNLQISEKFLRKPQLT